MYDKKRHKLIWSPEDGICRECGFDFEAVKEKLTDYGRRVTLNGHRARKYQLYTQIPRRTVLLLCKPDRKYSDKKHVLVHSLTIFQMKMSKCYVT